MNVQNEPDQENIQALQQYQNYDLFEDIVQNNNDQFVKFQTDLAIKFFIQSPFGQIYKDDLVEATADTPLSKIYDHLTSHASEFKFNGQRVVIKISPICKDQLDIFYRIEIYNVTKNGNTADFDSCPLAVFILITDQALIIKCPHYKHFTNIIQKNSLFQLQQGIFEYSKYMRNLERQQLW